jgi:uncharacterized delta-60 repeat protein
MNNIYTRVLLLSIISAILFLPSKVIGQNAGNIEPTFHYGKGTGWDYSLSNSSAYHTVIQDGALLPDGKIVFGANLSMDYMHGVRRKALAKINSNGTVDLSFAGPTSINNVTKVYPLSSGKFIMIGTSLGRAAIARYNADGTYDNTWNPAGVGPNDTRLMALAFQADGKMIIGGFFSAWNGVTANRIIRLNTDGTVDATFLGNVNQTVYEVKVLSNGKILIGGDFTQVSGVTKNYLALLNSDGSLDNTFPASSGVGPNNRVTTIAPLSDGKILFSGSFTTYNGTSRNRLFRINADGSPDATFTQNINVTCPSLIELSDGKYLAVGSVSVTRLNSNGTTDATFTQVVPTHGGGSPNFTKGILQPDGKILVFGQFSKLNGVPVEDVGRINADGTIDATFNELVGANNQPTGIQITSDGKLYVTGSFDAINGKNRTGFARLNADGSYDNAYNTGTGPNTFTSDVAIDPSTGKAVIVGTFTTADGTTRNRIARYNTDGTLDATFAPSGGLNNQVNSVVVQADGKIIVGGVFTQANGTNIGRLARFNTNGTLDATFAANVGSDGFSDQVLAIALQPDGKILVAGYFTTYKGVTAARNMCRLNADGTRDASFVSPTTGAAVTIFGITVQPDEKIIVTGQFTAYNGVSRANITRLNADGTNDASFVIGTGFNQYTRRSVLTAEGKIVVTGNFTTFNGVTRNTVARLKANGNIDYIFDPGAGTFGSGGLGAAVGYPNPIVLTPAGDIITGGDFFTYQGKAVGFFTKIQGTGCGNLAAPTIALSGGAASYCSPGTRTLTASAGAGYLWSNGATTQAITVSESGSYTVRFIDETCTSAASLPTVITVTQTPATPTITGNNFYCSGGSTVLTSSSPTGNFWSNGATSQSITVTGSAAYNVRVINGTCTSAVSNTITTTQPNVTAPTISGTNSFCSGSFTVLTASSAVGYLWSTGETTQSISVSTAGFYTVRATIGGCTGTASAATVVTVNNTPSCANSYNVSTLAGTGSNGSTNATGTAASFNGPNGMVVDASGNTFVADANNHLIRKITAIGVVTTFAGSGTPGFADGDGTAAQFNEPSGIAIDASGNFYVADRTNHSIRKITPEGSVSTLAGTNIPSYLDATGSAARFNNPSGIVVASSGDLFVTDLANQRIRRITSAGVVTTFAGSGAAGATNNTGTSAQFNGPFGITIDASGNIYVSELTNHNIRRITTGAVVTTLAGGGTSGYTDNTGTSARFNTPRHIIADLSGNIYVSDYNNSRIRRVTSAGVVSTIAGSASTGLVDGASLSARFNLPIGIAIENGINLLVSEIGNHTIRKIIPCTTPATPTISGTTTFCAGNSTVLTSSSPTGNLWSTGETTSSITVTTAGAYTVRVVNGTCTSSISATTNVTVTALPNAPTITGTTTICAGASTVLTSSNATGNIWSTGATTQTITVTTAGSYTVRLISGSCTSVASAATVVTVNSIPTTPTISNTGTSFCAGGSSVLTSSTGSAYIWSTGATTQSITVTTTGSYTVRVIENGCTSAISTATSITVNPTPSTPSITASTTLCSDNFTTLFSSSPTGNVWSTGETTQSINVYGAGSYTVYRIANGCTSATSAATVLTVTPTPSAPTITGNSGFCSAGSTVLTSSSATGNLWSTGATTQTITVTTAGSYSVRFISSGCTSVSSNVITTAVLPTGGWLGTTTDWNTASNWCGGVPTGTTDVVISSSGNLPTLTGTSSICRNLSIQSGRTITINNAVRLSVNGNIVGPGTINGVAGSILNLQGTTTSQTIAALTIGTLIVNNSQGVLLGGNVSVRNGVTLTNGILNTQTNNLSFLGAATSPTEIAASYIIGNVRNSARTVGVGSVSILGISIAAGTDNLDTVMIQRTESAATFNGNQGIGHVWSIRAGNQPISGRQITLAWNARADNGKTLSALQVYRRPDIGGNWIRVGTIQNGSSRSVTITTTSFSDWTLSDNDAPLPVTLSSFTGKVTPFGNQLNWTTSSEVNNLGFHLERSTDGRNFTKIGFVKGFGNTNTKQTYQFTDVNSSEAYYRLQQVDFDGKTEYSPTIKVGESDFVTMLEVFPNPASDKVTIRTNGEGTLEIVNMVGKVVITQPATKTNEINISKLAKGVYTVKFNGVSQKLVVR